MSKGVPPDVSVAPTMLGKKRDLSARNRRGGERKVLPLWYFVRFQSRK